MQSTRAVRAEYTNCTQCLRFGLEFAAGFAFCGSFAPALFVFLFPPLTPAEEGVTTSAVASASAAPLGTLPRLRFSPAGWERGRVLGKCATYELSTTVRAILACVRGEPPQLLDTPLITGLLLVRLST